MQINFVSQSFLRITACLICAWPASALAQAEGLRPMRGLRPTTFWEQNWEWITACSVLSIVMLVSLAVWLVRREKPKHRLSPAEEARLRLGQAADFAEGQDDKAFSITVSNALRHYLERAFTLRAPEQTTEEFLEAAKTSNKLPEPSLNTLAHFLELCDLAKFAQHAFGQEERNELLNTARSFVDEAEHRNRAPEKEVAAS